MWWITPFTPLESAPISADNLLGESGEGHLGIGHLTRQVDEKRNVAVDGADRGAHTGNGELGKTHETSLTEGDKVPRVPRVPKVPKVHVPQVPRVPRVP